MARAFISYLNDDDQKREGYYELLEKTENYLKFRTKEAVITISYNRLLKLKEVDDEKYF
jgi:hypothetical protein